MIGYNLLISGFTLFIAKLVFPEQLTYTTIFILVILVNLYVAWRTFKSK